MSSVPFLTYNVTDEMDETLPEFSACLLLIQGMIFPIYLTEKSVVFKLKDFFQKLHYCERWWEHLNIKLFKFLALSSTLDAKTLLSRSRVQRAT